MKANELLIGDWVKIYAEGVYYTLKISIDDFRNNNFPNYEPIPLTEEILKANGFSNKTPQVTRTTLVNEYGNHHSIVYILPNSRLHIWHDNHKILNVKCSAVHELQHALRLCGLNELADNFKLQA